MAYENTIQVASKLIRLKIEPSYGALTLATSTLSTNSLLGIITKCLFLIKYLEWNLSQTNTHTKK